MKRRNWLELSRKLVDQYDMDFSILAIQQELGQYALSFWGEGVLATALYPDPFIITPSILDLGGSVGYGVGYNDEGQICEINPSSTTAPTFIIPTADPTLDRWDLLVLRYKETGDTPIPKPSDPISTVNLNIHDDFALVVRPGTPSATPAYPSQQAGDIVLAGIRVPAGSTFGSQCTFDLAPREVSRANFQVYPVFEQEELSGDVDGINATFAMTKKALNVKSLLVLVDRIPLKETEYSYDGLVTVTLNDPPAIGQDVTAYYVVDSDNSENPLSAFQETPSGVIDGVNNTFTLAGVPADQKSTMVFINSLKLKTSEWTLQVSGTTAKIIIGNANIPVAGQDVYAFYFVNPKTVGTGTPGPSPSSGGGRWTPYGTIGAPEVVDPTIGVTVSSDERQLHFIRGQAFADPVTANPQLSPGAAIGDQICLKGTSDLLYSVFEDGNGLALNGPWSATNKSSLTLTWDGAVWSEDGRR